MLGRDQYAVVTQNSTADTITFRAASQNPIHVAVNFTFPSVGQYEIRVIQKTETSTDTRTQNEATLTMVQSYNNDKVLNLQRPHTFVETSIVASDQINGVIQNFSAIGTSVLRDFDKGGWNGKYVATRNPALIALDVLAGTENSSPLTDDQIDFVSWNALKNHCNNQVTLTVGGKTETVTNHVCDVVVDTSQTVQELVNSILTTARAQLNIQQNGKFGVMIDDTKTVPRQLFTPANSWNFSGTRTFAEIPDALKVKFIDPGLGWQLNEQIVYYDGKNAGNARVFEDLETYGITDYIQAHRYGRYMMKSGVLRSELFSINVDVENLVVTRGDLVAIQHDVPKMGGMAFRIVEINGAVITLDHDFIAPANAGYTYRTIDGDVKTGIIVSSTIDTITLQTADPDMGVDDLIVVGERDKVTRNYMVRGIAAGNDLTATLELVLYDDAVYTEGAIPEWDPGFGDDLLSGTDLEVFDINHTNTITHENRYPFSNVHLVWQARGNIGTLEKYDIYYTGLSGVEKLIASTFEPSWTHVIDILNETEYMGNGTYRIVPVNGLGVEGVDDSHSLKPLRDITPPEQPTGFAINVQGETTEIFWHLSNSPDVAYYEVRYSPLLIGASYYSAQHLTKVNFDTDRTTAGSRTGTYFITATDTSGNISKPLAMRTTVETLPHIDIVKTINDRLTGWLGNLQGFVPKGASLMSEGQFGNVVPLSIYQFEEIFDAGSIQELRIASKVQAYGLDQNDVIETWVPLASAIPLASANRADWDAWLEVSTSDDSIVMADWVPLNNANAIPIGAASVGWTPWRRVEVMDAVGRFFKFRIVAESNDPHVKVVVSSGEVEIDVVERRFALSDVPVSAGQNTINFVPSFREKPAVAITIENTPSPLRYEIISKTNSQLVFKFVDMVTGADMPGQADIIAVGYGKGATTSI